MAITEYGDGVRGSDGADRKFDDPISEADQKELTAMLNAFDEIVKMGRAAKTYRDIVDMNARFDELCPDL